MFEHKVIFETYCFDNHLDLERKKKTTYNKQMCEQNSCFETKMSQKSCFETKCENKTFASKPKCFLKNLASKLKCLNTNLILKPNVWTNFFFQTKMFFKKSCYEVQMSEYLQVLLWNQMLEQKSCFKTKMFEQRSFN